MKWLAALGLTLLPLTGFAQFQNTTLISTSSGGIVTSTFLYGRTASFTTLAVGGQTVTGGSSSVDRIVSTSANVVAGNGGTVSFTTGGVSGTAYIDTIGRLVTPGISATSNRTSLTTLFVSQKTSVGANNSTLSNTLDISGTFRLRPGSGGATCNSNNYGEMQFDSSSTVVGFCGAAGWKYVTLTVPLETYGYFVLTQSTYQAATINNLSGADSICLSELSSGTWKGKSDASARGILTGANVFGFLCNSTTCRNLQNNTTYAFARAGSATAGGATFTTNGSGQGPGNTTAWTDATYFDNLGSTVWTGRSYSDPVGNYWSTSPLVGVTACSNWTDNAGKDVGGYGSTQFSGYMRWYTGVASMCSEDHRLICFVNP